jgi:hypothetical protein
MLMKIHKANSRESTGAARGVEQERRARDVVRTLRDEPSIVLSTTGDASKRANKVENQSTDSLAALGVEVELIVDLRGTNQSRKSSVRPVYYCE